MPTARRVKVDEEDPGISNRSVETARVLRSGRIVATTPAPKALSKRPPARVPACEAVTADEDEGQRTHIKTGPARILQQQTTFTEEIEEEAKQCGVSLASSSQLGTNGPVDTEDYSASCGVVESGDLLEIGPVAASKEAVGELLQLCADIQELQEDVQRESQSESSQYSLTGSHRSQHSGSNDSQHAHCAAHSIDASRPSSAGPPFDPLSTSYEIQKLQHEAELTVELEEPSDSPERVVRLVSILEADVSDTDDEGSDLSSGIASPAHHATQQAEPLAVQQVAEAPIRQQSDSEERLESLRTKMLGVHINGSEWHDTLDDFSPLANGYVPRPTSNKPSYMAKKVQDLHENEWQSHGPSKVHKHRLEIVKEEAARARRNSLGSAEKALTRRLVRNAISQAVQTGGKGLGEDSVRHKSKLERAKEEASRYGARRNKPVTSEAPQGLGAVLKTYKSRLELEKEAARAPNSGSSDEAQSRISAAERHSAGSRTSLGSSLRKHKSALEIQKEKAASLSRPTQAKSSSRAVLEGKDSEWEDLSSMRVHKSKLELAKELAKGQISSSKPPAHPERRPLMCWNGVNLGEAKPHKSRIQKEKEAWQQAAQREDTRRNSASL